MEHLFFDCDYVNGAHPAVLQQLLNTNNQLLSTYGFDVYSERAKEKIRTACQAPEAEVFFAVGGTQANTLVISSLLRGYEGVVCTQTGHINCHEAGAIESTGHKVLSLPHAQGKLEAAALAAYLAAFYADGTHEHMVAPGMVYISHPTEYGTLYTRAELEALSKVCKEYALPLYLDGARLGYGLASYDTDVTLPDIARLCDAFYIGGTKVGALCGEAIVFRKAPKGFFSLMKRHGAVMAKGRVLGVQFDALFTDGLYEKIGRHAIDMAQRLKQLLRSKGIPFYTETPTNQQFVILENTKLRQLANHVRFDIWEPLDEEHTVVRFCTSWSTSPEDLEALEKYL